MPPHVPDTRPLFRPLCADIAAVLRSLPAPDWNRPTLAPAWRVRDVAAHLLDTALRRLSFHRDAMTPPGPAAPLGSERELAGFINELNATWIAATARLSPRVLVDLYAAASRQLCEFVEAFPDGAPALFPVSWAGDDEGADGLLDLGREFTEVWHHGAQIRDAVGAGPFPDPHWLQAVLAIAVRALPHAYRNADAAPGSSLVLDITGRSGGTWTLRRTQAGWEISSGDDPAATARATMEDEIAWRLFFNALPEADRAAARLSGDLELARPLLRVRSVIV